MKRIQQQKFTFCTIIARNYLAQARVLVNSIKEHHPHANIDVLVIDAQANELQESFPTTTLSKLQIPDVEQLAFKYAVTEFATAVKPYYFTYLFEKKKADQIVFLDPDIQVYSPLEELTTKLKTHDIILTPHITSPYYDNKNPSELTILRSGPYNLGFIALKKTTNVLRFLLWWEEKLYHHCYLRGNLFVDQKWLIMADSLFERVCVLKHPGYNVAYWNLHERTIEEKNNKRYVNNMPLRFFHFSGYEPRYPKQLSKHQNRFYFHQLNNQTKNLFETYRAELYKAKYKNVHQLPYRFNYYTNKKKISRFERRIFSMQKQQIINPFSTQKKSFYRYMRQGLFLKDVVLFIIVTTVTKSKQFLYTLLNFFMGKATTQKIKEVVQQKDPFHKAYSTRYTSGNSPYGVNLLGYHTTESGMGESARSMIRILQNTTIPYILNNDASTNSRQLAIANKEKIKTYNTYACNLLIINGDRFHSTLAQATKDYFINKKTIAYWTWELETIPAHWPASHPLIDEFWVPSTFVQRALQRATTKPVQIMPHSIPIPKLFPKQQRNKKPFTFLFMFDFYSYIERKNPFAIIAAFKQAFAQGESVQLIIKCINESFDPKAFRALKQAAKQQNISILNMYLSRAQVEQLLHSCDCYISLHRSEGFGLTIAEAMAYEKPVIVTAYSGNMDFCTPENSYLVPYTLIPITKNHGPYTKGNKWANPHVDVAATYMRRVYTHPKEAKQKAKYARKTIQQQFTPSAIAPVVQTRIDIIHKKLKTKTK
jgi:glycosyltransferase involved in cell wall biosynthesis